MVANDSQALDKMWSNDVVRGKVKGEMTNGGYGVWAVVSNDPQDFSIWSLSVSCKGSGVQQSL